MTIAIEPRSRYLSVAGHEIHVTEWGDRAAPPVVMWHGLARVGRDFDVLARALAPMYRIICPDTIGRGLSSWSAKPDEDYTIHTYCAHAIEIMDQLGIGKARWVGTSMGGIIGMALAGSEAGAARIERLVINDVGPELVAEAVDRIKAYVTMVPEFPTIERFEAFLRVAYAPFGKLTDSEWRNLAETSVRRRDSGTFSAHYDPAVMRVFAETAGAMDMWELYDNIRCPTLVLRGETSDLLAPLVAEAMTKRGPKALLISVDGCGHAPMLNTADQIAVLKGFLA
ncbi:MAG TPA: alpha/beta hydrolase [Magnetospirillum sp.]|jgi:pimeloyl-ACP methyl ester carboxylesterase|nr:alpha/beta hydrolase [Magnetospirillum sp.]